jgi:hypothetical protein
MRKRRAKTGRSKARKPDRRRMRRLAKARVGVKSDREAARRAGETSKRALSGVLASEWRAKFPEFVAMEQEFAEKAMSGREWDERNTILARGLAPSRIFFNAKGEVTGGMCDVDKAMDRHGNSLGKLKDRHILTGPNDGPIQHELANVPTAELERRLAKNLKAIGGAPARE